MLQRLGLVVILLTVASCKTQSLYVRPVTPATTGVTYSLPKTLTKVDVTYTVVTKTTYVNGRAEPPQKEVLIEKPVVITPMTIADYDQRFTISAEDAAQNAFLATNSELKLSDSGALVSLDAEFDDRSLEVAGSLVSAGIQIAKIAAVAGSGSVPGPLAPVIEAIEGKYEAIGRMANSKAKDRSTKLEALKKELDTLIAVVAAYQSQNRTDEAKSDISYSVVVEPEKCTPCEIAPAELVKGIPTALMPKIELSFGPSDVDDKFALPAEGQAGIVVRTPKPVPVTLAVTNVGQAKTVVLSDQMAIAQFGRRYIVPVSSKRWGKRKTSIVLANNSGAVKEYKVVSDSSAEKAASKLDSSLQKVQESLLDIRYGLEISELQKQKALLDAQNALKPAEGPTAEQQRLAELEHQKKVLALEKEIAELRKELEKLKP